MGLDTVELIQAIEDRFGISIPDLEAEQISSIADAADCVCRHLRISIEIERSAVFCQVLEKAVDCLEKQRIIGPPVIKTALLSSVWPEWQGREGIRKLGECSAMEVPKLPNFNSRTGVSAWLFGTGAPSHKSWPYQTVTDLVDWIIALNHVELLSTVTSLYDVQRIVVGITSDKTGVPVEEIALTDRFTYDLGMD